jgi:hypothetical protein
MCGRQVASDSVRLILGNGRTMASSLSLQKAKVNAIKDIQCVGQLDAIEDNQCVGQLDAIKDNQCVGQLDAIKDNQCVGQLDAIKDNQCVGQLDAIKDNQCVGQLDANIRRTVCVQTIFRHKNTERLMDSRNGILLDEPTMHYTFICKLPLKNDTRYLLG